MPESTYCDSCDLQEVALGIYDVGAMLYGSADVFSYAFAVSNGTVKSVKVCTRCIRSGRITKAL